MYVAHGYNFLSLPHSLNTSLTTFLDDRNAHQFRTQIITYVGAFCSCNANFLVYDNSDKWRTEYSCNNMLLSTTTSVFRMSNNNTPMFTANQVKFTSHMQQYIYTGWLKLKYPTVQNGFSRQPCKIFIPKFLDLYGRDPATILKFKKNYFSFLQSYGYINILCHIFDFVWNNQQQLVIFIVKKHWLLLQIVKSDK